MVGEALCFFAGLLVQHTKNMRRVLLDVSLFSQFEHHFSD